VEQRRLLKPFSSSVWGLFRRVKNRFHELRLHAEDVLIQLDADHDHCVDHKEFKLGLRRMGVQVADEDLNTLFKVLLFLIFLLVSVLRISIRFF
jgi:hypothetical protein